VRARPAVHILLTIHAPMDPDAGAPGVTSDLGFRFRAESHNVTYLSFDDMPRWFPSRAVTFLFPAFLAWRIWRLSARQGIDVIDASSGDLWLWASLRRRNRARPLLVTRSHGLEHTAHEQLLEDARRGTVELSWKYPIYYGGFRLWEVARSLRLSDLDLFLNRADLEYAVIKLGIPREKARLTVNGVGEDFQNLPFTPIAEGVSEPIKIAQIGSYIPRKGVGYGAAALNRVLRRHSSITVSMLGTQAPAEAILADFDPEVRQQVVVLPTFKRDRLPSLLSDHHIKLLPTTFEGFSVSLIEAMACGLAPVTTATPGPMEIVRDGVNGVLVPPRNSEAIVQALERLLGDTQLLDRLRRSAYATAQGYAWDRIGRETLALYREALARKEASPAVRP
jgi:glycosyltransferase involved in cell wall biosynthesis